MSRIGAVILARLDSTRLPNKALLRIGDKPLIEHVCSRVQKALSLDDIVVATTDRPNDDRLAHECESIGVHVYRGATDDVAGRFLNAMQTREHDYAVRINGDNLFVMPSIIDQMTQICRTEEFDFVSNVPGRTFPFGVSIEIVRAQWYGTMYEKMKSSKDREHVTSFLYDHGRDFGRSTWFENRVVPEAAGLQLAIDTPADARRAEAILSRLNEDEALDLAAVVAAARQVNSASL